MAKLVLQQILALLSLNHLFPTLCLRLRESCLLSSLPIRTQYWDYLLPKLIARLKLVFVQAKEQVELDLAIREQRMKPQVKVVLLVKRELQQAA